ncbi:MAG: hypothetical protein QF578_15535 [Alphaproteobacteria bacterium]|jgi:hypothetical protein|nr:hypothetical protein [Alphaproteobacteria bacterium]MDP6815184.1 hypothetical protein [Alphaproteobacteria bacterium]
MTDDRDPALQALFAEVQQDLPADAFTAQVMSRIDRLNRRRAIAWICAGLVLAPGVWWITGPLQDAVLLLAQGLAVPLIDLENRLLADVVAPLNNVASVFALALLGLRAAYRRVSS